MTPTEAIEKLERQKSIIKSLEACRNTKAPEFKKWDRDTEVALRNIFGDDSRQVKELRSLPYSLGMALLNRDSPEPKHYEAYIKGLKRADILLESMIDEIKDYGLSTNSSVTTSEPLAIVETLCQRFHRFARQLQQRHNDRSTIDIEDEYDLQDVFHALLRLHFDDVRPEEYTPSYAGAASRMDFLLKQEKLVIELKKTRANLKAKEVGEQLTIDIARYSTHPDCQCLVCFVYDPDGKISNPDGLEKDLERQSSDKLKVRVIIAPKN